MSEVNELEAIRNRAEMFCGVLGASWDEEAQTDRRTLLRLLDAARAALQFYADPASHVGHRDPRANVYIETSAIDADGGERARAALKEKP
jgi:hypothetical protein